MDECHYVTSAGRCFRPEFHTSIRALIGRLWNKCPMLFCSATMNKCSIHHLSLMLHPQSPLSSSAKLMPDMGVDDPSLKLPLIDPLPTKFFTGIIWGNVGRQGINVNIEFTTDWVNSVKTNVVSYANNRCRVLGYCSSAMDAKDTVHPKVQKILRDAGVNGITDSNKLFIALSSRRLVGVICLPVCVGFDFAMRLSGLITWVHRFIKEINSDL